MTTRTKLTLASYTGTAMILLVVFSNPLHIPEVVQWVLIVGVFIAAGLMLLFLKQHKLASQAASHIPPKQHLARPPTPSSGREEV